LKTALLNVPQFLEVVFFCFPSKVGFDPELMKKSDQLGIILFDGEVVGAQELEFNQNFLILII
jgi:hypothetical protein